MNEEHLVISETTGLPENNGARGVVLVTGAAGFTGSTAVDYLLQHGYPVLATDRPGSDFKAIKKHKYFMRTHPHRYEGVSLDIETADLTKPASLKKLLKGKNIKYLLHPAAVFDFSAPRDLLWKVNVDGTRNLLDALDRNSPDLSGVAVWSTSLVYGNAADLGPLTETTVPNPSNSYAESKLAQENVVMEYHAAGMKTVILRPATVYGPRGQYGFAKGLGPLSWCSFLPMMPVPGEGDTVSSYVHVDDVVGAAMHLIYALGHESIEGHVFNVADDTPQSAAEILTEASRQLRVPEPQLNIPDKAYEIFNRVAPRGYKVPFLNIEREEIPYLLKDHLVGNSLLKETGYLLKYPDTLEGMRATIDWYARNRKLAKVWYAAHPNWKTYWKDISLNELAYADYALAGKSGARR